MFRRSIVVLGFRQMKPAVSTGRADGAKQLYRTTRSLITSQVKEERRQQRRTYNFASQAYASCFENAAGSSGGIPTVNSVQIRQEAVSYLERTFDDQLWYKDPVVSLVNGRKLQNGNLSNTIDAFGRVNGQIMYASESEVNILKHHVTTYQSPYTDLRDKLTKIEHELLTAHVGFLIGNQAIDFSKQDGVTEIEESIQANVVERRMNDLLISDELKGMIQIKRNMAIVGCDLFRKTIRNLSLGVPCLILSRSNTTQHMYRWTELLLHLLKKYDIDPGMLTYASCNLEGIKAVVASIPDSPLYITCSRSLAKSIKTNHSNTISSTGGPNTLVATSKLNPAVSDAIRVSATIENSGQCTALRLVVAPGMTEDDIIRTLNGTVVSSSALECLKSNQFANIFDFSSSRDSAVAPEYVKHPNHNAYYCIREDLPQDNLEEYWRRVVIDVTTKINVEQLAMWLVRNQPISLAINGADSAIARELFEKTGLVVYTVGSTEKPALTCQARPQEAEVFGEFPPRRRLDDYTKYPVIVPSSTPSYNAFYKTDYLESLEVSNVAPKLRYVGDLLGGLKSKVIRGYCIELVNYLAGAAVGPRERFGSRTVLWGLQRPPLNGQLTVLRCDSKVSLDDILPWLIPFYVTNARNQLQLSIDSGASELLQDHTFSKYCNKLNIVVEDETSFFNQTEESSNSKFYNVVFARKQLEPFPMVGNWVSRLLLQGHIKSTSSNDQQFISNFKDSPKWLKLATI